MTARASRLTKLSPRQEPPILEGIGMKLNDLLAGAGAIDAPASSNAEISSLVYKSAEAATGCVFVAMRGEVTDGNRFVFDAVNRGARVVVSELPPPPGPAWEALL